MKKLLMTMLTILTCGAAYALPIGNPADPVLLTEGVFLDADCADSCDPCDPCSFDWNVFSLRFGYYGDFVFDRDLEVVSSDEKLRHAEIYTNAGLIALNLWDRVDFYGTLGGTTMNFASTGEIFGLGGAESTKINTDTEFSWSVGLRGVLWECGCTTIGFDARYFRTRPDVRTITTATTSIDLDDVDVRYREWQFGLAIAHRINMFVPYFGVKWSNADVDFRGTFIETTETPVSLPSFKEENHWGYAFGVSLVDCDMMSLNVEARLRDEKAIAVNAQIRF